MAAAAVQRDQQLRELLIAFQQSPGKYSRALRQPSLLYASLRDVLQIAIGRGAGNDTEFGRAAARFFVLSALLHPAATHYELLGLEPDASEAMIKERYRLLMRLLHPDFAGSGAPWPAGTAARVNLAYEVLSSPERRLEYDASIRDAAVSRPFGRGVSAPPRYPLVRRDAPAVRARRRGLRALMIGCAVLGTLALAVALLPGRQDERYLVQRQRNVSQVQEPLAAAAPAMAELPPPPPQARPMPAPAGLAVASLAPVPAAAPPPLAAAAMPSAQMRGPVPPATLAAPRSEMVMAADPAEPEAAAPAATPAAAGRLSVGPVTESPMSAVPAAARASATVPSAPTLADVQPALAALLHAIETGRGDQVLDLLARDAVGQPAQAFARSVEKLAASGPVRVATVQFNAEPAAGRLMVTGHMGLATGAAGAPLKLQLRMEFSSRGGAVTMTGLSGGAP